jgi:endonuclease YncB( thermonuclease family)
MTTFSIHYLPEHLEVGNKPIFRSATGGNTTSAELPIRMLGIDAPELQYASAVESKPGAYDRAMADFLTGKGKDLDQGLRTYLEPRLESGACTRHLKVGKAAHEHYQAMLEKRLARVSKSRKPLTPRRLFVMVADEIFDKDARLLAYLNASYTKEELKQIPASKRPTFNLQVLQEGYAASLLIFPNVPKPGDLEPVRKAVETARAKGRGLWQDELVLLGFEFRWIVDTILGKRSGPDRLCADLTTGALYQPQQYWRVLPENRLFFHREHASTALDMGFWPVP